MSSPPTTAASPSSSTTTERCCLAARPTPPARRSTASAWSATQAGYIVGFDGTATELADAYGATGGIDGGLAYGPGGVLFYSTFFANQIGQIEPGSTGPDRLVNLSPGVARSMGGLGFVPEGMPGAGRLKITSTLVGRWYDATLTPDGSGTYNVVRNTAVAINIGGSPQGIVYVPAGAPLFPNPTVLVAEFQSPGRVSAYEVNANGDPIPSTRRTFIDGLDGAEGAAFDPLTGDFLFSTFGGGDLIVRVSVVPEPATWALLALGLAILGVTVRRRLSAGAAAASSGARAVWPPAPAAAAPSGTSPA